MSVEILSRLFEPVRVAGIDLPNRIAMAPMSRYLCPEGRPHQAVADYYRRRAEGGVGLVISEGTYIPHPSAAGYRGVPWFDAAALPGWKAVADAVHAAGGKMMPQLWHTGSFRAPGMPPDPAWPGLGPSENANPVAGHDAVTRAMSESEIADVIAAYAQAAGDAKSLGFDGVEIHAAHGYLIDEFLWERTNRRTDRWGGDRRGRTRFAAAVVAAVRERVGPDFPISYRYSLWKQQDYQAKLADTPDELAEVLTPIVDAGASLIHCSTRRLWTPGFPDLGEMTLAGWTRKVTGLPVIAVGGVGLDRAGLNEALPAPLDPLAEPFARGEFDILAVGRALLGDANWAAKMRDPARGAPIGYAKAHLKTLD